MTDPKRDTHQLREGQPPRRPEAPKPTPVMKVEETWVFCDMCNGQRETSNGEPCMLCSGTGRKFASIVYRYERPQPSDQGGDKR